MRYLTVLTLALLLLAPAQAEPPASAGRDPFRAEKGYSVTGHTFRADFPGKIVMEQKAPGIVKYYAHDKSDSSLYGVAVFTGSQKRHMADLKRYLIKQGIKALEDVSHRDVHIGTVKGIEFQGIDRQGTPMTIRLYVDQDHSYVVAASGFDLSKNRNFVESFRIRGQK